MLRSFSLARFRFALEPEGRLALHPRNPGNTLRGAFGATFKRLVCPTPGDCRETCRLKTSCPYGQIFEPSPSPGAERLSLNQDIPRPFILRPPAGHRTITGPGESLFFEVILIGKAIEFLPFFLVTFRELGQQGIGIGRGRYSIGRVLALDGRASLLGGEDRGKGDIVYSSTDQLVRPSPHRLTFDDCRRAAELFSAHGRRITVHGSRFTDHGQRITLRFVTPTHLKANGTIVQRPEFHHLIKRLRDRINALAHFYCEDSLDVEYKAFGQRAESVRTVRCHVRWEDRDRRSWKTGLTHDMGGFVGEVTYEGELEEFLPLLILGQYTHVGKYAVWGNGWYVVKAL